MVNVPNHNIRCCITGRMVNVPNHNHNIRFCIKGRMLNVPNHNIRCCITGIVNVPKMYLTIPLFVALHEEW